MPNVNILVPFCFFFVVVVLSCMNDETLGKKKHLCIHRQPQFGHFSGYHSQKVSIEITWPLFEPRHTKKQESHPVLATSICFSLILLSFFLHYLLLCYCCITKIFLRDVHECLQCPPHWNTWGKVSSLHTLIDTRPTAWATASGSSPAEDVLLLEMMGNFLRFLMTNWNFFSSLNWLVWELSSKKIYRILFGVSELAVVIWSSAFVVSNFKVSMAQETVEVEGGGNRILGGRDGFLRCIVIKAS